MTHTLRSARGYRFEKKHIVKELNKDGWICERLGGTSMGMPDEIATNNDRGILLAFEAKSTVGNYCYVPNDQLERCKKIYKMFNYYWTKYIVLAFKFAGIKKYRKLRYYFFILHPPYNFDNIQNVRCSYDGKIVFNGITDKDIISYSICHSIEELKKYFWDY